MSVHWKTSGLWEVKYEHRDTTRTSGKIVAVADDHDALMVLTHSRLSSCDVVATKQIGRVCVQVETGVRP